MKPVTKDQLEDDSTPDEDSNKYNRATTLMTDIKKAPRIHVTQQKLQEVLKHQTMKVRMVNRGSLGNIKMPNLKLLQQLGSSSNLADPNAAILKFDKSQIQRLSSKLESTSDLENYNSVLKELADHLQAENASREDAGAEPMIRLIKQLSNCAKKIGKKTEAGGGGVGGNLRGGTDSNVAAAGRLAGPAGELTSAGKTTSINENNVSIGQKSLSQPLLFGHSVASSSQTNSKTPIKIQGLRIDKIKKKHQSKPKGFHEQFMGMYDQFSKSWRD